MKFYICVYLQKIPEDKDCERVHQSASDDPVLKKYLRRYKNRFKKNKSGIGRFYDWGDDPAFFASEQFGGNVTWGVCRHDVRGKLKEGDVVVFFCAQEHEKEKQRKKWEYYYVGFGTVGDVVDPREQLWKKSRYQKYRKYYNLLINKNSCHREPIDDHDDWAKRLAARYIIFEATGDKTHFNVTNPLHVATYTENNNPSKGKTLEKWLLDEERVKRICKLISPRDGGKKLRTSSTGNAHVHMNLSGLGDKELEEKRREFLKISRAVAKE